MNITWPCPRVDSHCHFGGMITPETIYDIAYPQLRMNVNDIRDAIVCGENDRSFDKFLEKFQILDAIKWDPLLIVATISDVCDNLHKNNIHCISISMSLNKYISQHITPIEAAKIIQHFFKVFSEPLNIECKLLLSLKYESPIRNQAILSEITNSTVFDGFDGIDFVGREDYLNPRLYQPCLMQWKQAGKTIRAHVGELPGTADNVKIAMHELGVTRIAHGIYADNKSLHEAADNNIVFDLALWSNMKTGAVVDMKKHPIRNMIDRGCLITLNTDDPVQFGCSIDDEFDLAMKLNLINEEESRHIMRTAYNHTHAHNRFTSNLI